MTDFYQRFCRKTIARILVFFVSVSLVFPPVILAELQDVVDSKESENVFLYVGDLVSVKVYSLTRIALSNPGVVDISTATADEIVLIGRKVGETPIFIWDEQGKRRLLVRVLADDLSTVAARIAALIQSARIDGVYMEKNYYEGKIVLTGQLNKDAKKKFDEAIKEFSPYIIDMIRDGDDLIQIDVQISELSKTLSEALGLDWSSAGDGLSLSYDETLPAATGKFRDLFKIGDFNRTQVIQATVNALISEGKGRILSKPSIVVGNGEEASFNVGGEIPVRTTTSTGTGVTQENVTFRSYGIDLSVTPEIIEGKINLQLNIQLRDIDSANAVGDNVAFTTRIAKTRVTVNDGQPIVIAGLIKRNKSESVNRLPFVSRIPVVGLLFRNRSNPVANTDLELVVSLRPKIYSKEFNNKTRDNREGITPQQEEVRKELTSEEVLSPNDAFFFPDDSKRKDQKAKSAKVKRVSGGEKKVSEKSSAKDKAGAAQKSKDKDKTAVKDSKKKSSSKGAKVKSKVQKTDKPKTEKAEPTAQDEAAELAKQMRAAKAKESSPAAGASGQELSMIDLEKMKLQEPTRVLTDEEIAELELKYSQRIRKEMRETISYPYEAREQGWSGTVMLDITLLPDGNVKDVVVKESSGRAIFDKDAVSTAQILAPYDEFAPGKNLRELKITVPVEYSEKAVLGNGNGNGVKSPEAVKP